MIRGGGQFLVKFSDVAMNEESCRYNYRKSKSKSLT